MKNIFLKTCSKKYVLYAIVALYTLFLGNLVYGDIGDVTISVPAGELYIGAFFKSEVEVDVGNNALGSFHFKIPYNEKILRIKDVECGDSKELPNDWLQYTNNNGELKITNLSMPTERPKGIVSLFKITFQVIDNINALENLSIEVISLLYPDSLENIDHQVINSVVKVSKLDILKALMCIKTLTGINSNSSMNIGRDQKLGISEIIYLLEYISKIRL